VEENCIIKLPVKLNCWKHHAGFVRKQIHSVQNTQEIDKLNSILRKIGDSQMDLYYGEHSAQEISSQIVMCLKRGNYFLPEQYKKWLSEHDKEYQLIELSDKSIWTLRLGEKIEGYVHIHPGRYSPLTIRVRATTLKTAILVLCLNKLGEIELINTETINQIRKKYLSETPIKSLAKASGLQKIIDLLSKK